MPSPRLEITYCTQCRWLLRAGWMAQELLTTFPADLGGFPELPTLKQLVRDQVAPDRSLGHSDGHRNRG